MTDSAPNEDEITLVCVQPSAASLSDLLTLLNRTPREAWVDLLHRDQADRWETGARICVEDYLRHFPEVAACEEDALVLICGEMQLRRRADQPLSLAEYQHRFPQFAAQLGMQWQINSFLTTTPASGQGGTLICPSCQESFELSEDETSDNLECPSCGENVLLGSQSTAHWSPSEIQRRLGGYDIIDRVGAGSFGTVYKARDPELDRIVAIKIPRAGSETSEGDVERFLREARSVARLRHPSVVSIYKVGEANGLPFLVSEFVDGITLADLLSAKQLPPREAAELVAAVADALQYAHDMGVVHRDVKPANIMLDGEGKPRLMDFGLARRETGDVTMTVDGQILGTPAYMSPEQAKGEAHRVDGRTDVYSLGVILYQLLTGELPFRGTTRMLLHQVLYDEPRSPRSLADHVPRDLETICLRAMGKEPSGRYATARDMSDDLQRFLKGEPIQARPIGRAERIWRWSRRNPLLAAMTAAAVLLFCGGFAGVTWNYWQAEAARKELDANLYFNRIGLAYSELRDNHVQQAQELLDQCPADRRAWEWFYLRRLCHTEPVTLRGQPGWSQTAAFSPDGLHVATASEDKSLKVWDTTTGQELLTLPEAGEVYCTAYRPSDGRWLVSGDRSGAVVVWDTTTRQMVRVLGRHAANVLCLAFSPNGRYLASAGEDMTVKVWDATTGLAVYELTGHDHRVVALAFSHDGQKLASGSFDTTVKIWNTRTGKLIDTLSSHKYPVTSVAFSPDDSRRLASSSIDRTVKIWDLTTGQVGVTLKGHLLQVYGVAFLDNGRRLASASVDKTVKIWDATSGRLILTLRGHNHDLTGLVASRDGMRLASSSGDRSVKIWDASPVQPKPNQDVLTLRGHTDQIWGLAYSPDGRRLASASWDATVRVWDVRTGREDVTFRNHSHSVTSVAFSPDGGRIASGSTRHAEDEPNALKVWDGLTGQEVLDAQADGTEAFGATFSPDGLWIATGDSRGVVTVWEAATGKAAHTLDTRSRRVYSLAFSPDGRLLAALSSEGMVNVYDAMVWSEKPLLAFRAHSVSVRGNLAFSPDGKRLVTPGDENTVHIWDITAIDEQESPTPQLILRGHTAQVWGVAFSHEGQWVASGSEDNTVRLFNATTGKPVSTFRGHSSVVSRVVFSPDKGHLASASFDKTVKIWNVSTILKVAPK